jgi:hypothetical protein
MNKQATVRDPPTDGTSERKRKRGCRQLEGVAQCLETPQLTAAAPPRFHSIMYAIRQNRIHVSNIESPPQRELSPLLHLLPLPSTSAFISSLSHLLPPQDPADEAAVLVLGSTSLHMLLTVADSPDPLHVLEGTYRAVASVPSAGPHSSAGRVSCYPLQILCEPSPDLIYRSYDSFLARAFMFSLFHTLTYSLTDLTHPCIYTLCRRSGQGRSRCRDLRF